MRSDVSECTIVTTGLGRARIAWSAASPRETRTNMEFATEPGNAERDMTNFEAHRNLALVAANLGTDAAKSA